MPEADYVWLPREDVLHFEEISALVDVFVSPRRGQGAPDRRRAAAPPRSPDARPAAGRQSPSSNDLAMTTNGILLAEQIDALKDAGLGRMTVSLDTLRPDRFVRAHALRRARRAVREGIAAAAPCRSAGSRSTPSSFAASTTTNWSS